MRPMLLLLLALASLVACATSDAPPAHDFDSYELWQPWPDPLDAWEPEPCRVDVDFETRTVSCT